MLLFALFCLCAGVFELRSRALGYANKALDGRWRGYSPEDVRKFFEAIGEDGRRLYARTERTLDVAFPIIYGSLFATLLTRFQRSSMALPDSQAASNAG